MSPHRSVIRFQQPPGLCEGKIYGGCRSKTCHLFPRQEWPWTRWKSVSTNRQARKIQILILKIVEKVSEAGTSLIHWNRKIFLYYELSDTLTPILDSTGCPWLQMGHGTLHPDHTHRFSTTIWSYYDQNTHTPGLLKKKSAMWGHKQFLQKGKLVTKLFSTACLAEQSTEARFRK